MFVSVLFNITEKHIFVFKLGLALLYDMVN